MAHQEAPVRLFCHELRGIGTHHLSGNLNQKARCGGRHHTIGLGQTWLKYKDRYRFEYKDGCGFEYKDRHRMYMVSASNSG